MLEQTTPSTVEAQTLAASTIARERLETTNKSGALWFFIIAVLSVVNSIIVLTGSQWNFIVGLGATQVVDGIIASTTKDESGVAAGVVMAIALMINILIAGIYFVLGIFARKQHSWAYLTGMILYGFDGLIFLFVAAWLNIAFHAFVLFSLFNGLKACKQLGKMEKL